MSMISELVKGLRKLGNQWKHNDVAAYHMIFDAAYTIEMLSAKLSAHNLGNGGWIPVSERLPSKEEMKEWIDNNLDGIGYLYPCLVTRYSSINPGRTKCNPYVAKHYFDGEDFVNNGEEVCSEYIIAWMPLPEPYREDGEA